VPHNATHTLAAGTIGLGMLLGLSPASAERPPPGTWSVYQDQGSVSINMSETLLADGTVLIAGGGDSITSATEAEIFTPSTNGWALVASMLKPRDQHTATLLPDGTVLAAGGTSSGTQATPVASAETYDPETNRWTLAGAMITPRFDQMAILLKTGKVLLCGGTQNVNTNLSSCELYNPATRRFTATGDMGSQRRYSTMVMLQSGDIMVDGDQSGAILYSVKTGHWRGAATPPYANFGATLSLLPDGRVMETPSLQAGVQRTQIYDPVRNSWSLAGKELARIYNATATLPNGLVLTTGGCVNDCANQNVATAELFHPDTGRWTVAPSMHVGREDHSAVTLPDGRVLVVGGGGPPEAYSY
jgi:hypothetical protein